MEYFIYSDDTKTTLHPDFSHVAFGYDMANDPVTIYLHHGLRHTEQLYTFSILGRSTSDPTEEGWATNNPPGGTLTTTFKL